ncbi:MAG TPA: hypothetical protein VFL57_13265 [Bryobacteraceae bacterium]|nr:hypothetical protein [Bryobacteraceae bacterium]
MLSRLVAAVAIGASAFAQQAATDVFEKAPPAVDEALRARVAQFFQAHVDGKFRVANEVVAEDSKDAFFAMDKKRYLSFEIARIVYSANFTKATVVTALEMDWRHPRLGVIRVKPPVTSLWKLEEGHWYWYVQPEKEWNTPFGKMIPGPDPAPGTAGLGPFRGADPAKILEAVKVSAKEVRLSSYEPSTVEITVTNTMPGKVTLEFNCTPMKGLTAKFDRTELNEGESARLRLQYSPPDPTPKPTLTSYIHVQQTGQNLPVILIFAIPPQVEKLIPKK